jgi:hypothetical protein
VIVDTETATYLLDLVAMKEALPKGMPRYVENLQHTRRAVVSALRMDGAVPFEILAPLEIGKPAGVSCSL